MRRARSLLTALGAAAVLGACAPRLPPCAGATDCRDGHECLANRCRWLGSDPVDPNTLRSVLEPARMGLIGGPLTDGATLPAAVTLGSASSSRVLWLLAFELPELGEVDSAFLLLEPVAGTSRSPADVPLRVWRVASEWSPSALTEREVPALAPPASHGVARPSPPTTVRLDLTGQVRFWRENPRANHGVAVEGPRTAAAGIVLDTGVLGGTRPRLEIYAAAP